MTQFHASPRQRGGKDLAVINWTPLKRPSGGLNVDTKPLILLDLQFEAERFLKVSDWWKHSRVFEHYRQVAATIDALQRAADHESGRGRAQACQLPDVGGHRLRLGLVILSAGHEPIEEKDLSVTQRSLWCRLGMSAVSLGQLEDPPSNDAEQRQEVRDPLADRRRDSSARQPDFRILWKISIFHRIAYHWIFSIASRRVRTGRSSGASTRSACGSEVGCARSRAAP
jgi:hypothetical protein